MWHLKNNYKHMKKATISSADKVKNSSYFQIPQNFPVTFEEKPYRFHTFIWTNSRLSTKPGRFADFASTRKGFSLFQNEKNKKNKSETTYFFKLAMAFQASVYTERRLMPIIFETSS